MAYGLSTRMFLGPEPTRPAEPAPISLGAVWRQLPRDARLAAVDRHLRAA